MQIPWIVGPQGLRGETETTPIQFSLVDPDIDRQLEQLIDR